MRMIYFNKEGLEFQVFYRIYGKGLPLVFLHGYLESMEIWKEFIPGFHDGFRVITVDLPGHGRSGVPGNFSTMDMMAGCVVGILDRHEIEKAFIIGHSMGGYTALAMLEHFPERLMGLSLFHSHPFADSPEVIKKRNREIEIVQKGYQHLLVSQNIPNMFAEDNLPVFGRELKITQRIAGKTGPEGIIAAIRGLMTRPDRSEILANANVPCLQIAGKKDKYIAFDQVSLQTRLPAGSEQLVLEHSGHMGFYEEKARALEGILRFLERF